jgi:hypothetical protein
MATKIGIAEWDPLGKQTQPRMGAWDYFCFHTIVGYGYSTFQGWKTNGYKGLESHFIVGGKWGSDGTHGWDGKIVQVQDLDYTADANLDGNWHVISCETGDNAPASSADIAAWTDKQMESLADLAAAVCIKCKIPPVLVPNTKKGNRGLAYHRQGCMHSLGYNVSDYLVRGGEKWSNATGKVCPGDRRVHQLKTELVPEIARRVEEGAIMALSAEDKKWFESTIDARLDAKFEDWLTKRGIVTNQLQTWETTQGKPFTIAGALSNIEKDGDRTNHTLESTPPPAA